MKTLKLHYRSGHTTSVRWGAFPPEWKEPVYPEVKDIVPEHVEPDASHITFTQRVFVLKHSEGNVGHYYEDLPAKTKEAKADPKHGASDQEEVEQSGPFMGKSGI